MIVKQITGIIFLCSSIMEIVLLIISVYYEEHKNPVCYKFNIICWITLLPMALSGIIHIAII